MLGTASLAGALLMGLTVDARPQVPQPLFTRQDAPSLNNESSCNDVINYQTALDNPGHITYDMYDKLDCSANLDYWFFATPTITNYVNQFATPWGVGQTFACNIGEGRQCDRINCADFGDAGSAKAGSGPAYAILLSFSNFNLYMNALYQGLILSRDQFSAVQVSIQQNYYPNDPPPITLKLLLVGIQTLSNIIGAASGVLGPVTAATIGSTAALVGGVLGGINAAMSTEDKSLANLADIETITNTWYTALSDNIEWANDNLTTTGAFMGVDPPQGLADIIAHGEWLDYTDHPLLNDDSSKPKVNTGDLNNALYLYLIGNIINYAWKMQGTFIVKYDMTQDDFDNTDWQIGGNSPDFKLYYGGSGFFLNRYKDDQDPLFPEPRTDYPPGYDQASTDLQGCGPTCAMQSAADAWHMYGFNYNFSTDSSDYLASQDSAYGWLTNLPHASGFWNIPVCELTGDGSVTDKDKLNAAMKDKDFSYADEAPKAVYCYCKDKMDGNGVSFHDAYVTQQNGDGDDINSLFDNSMNCDDGYDAWKG